MKRSIKSLQGYTLKETDGEIGKVEEFYFDDQSWTIRYLIVKTGNWFSDKKVLISPTVIKQSDWDNREFSVNLTQDQIKNSPDIDTDKPVSRLMEEELSAHYQWQEYWGIGPYAHGAGIFGMMPSELYNEAEIPTEVPKEMPVDDSVIHEHLRSTKAITGYKIHATNGQIGEVVDYIVDESTWEIKFIVIDTGTWLDSKKVLLSTQWLKEVNWDNKVVIADVTTEQVIESPEFDDNILLNEDYEKNLYDYYGRTQEVK